MFFEDGTLPLVAIFDALAFGHRDVVFVVAVALHVEVVDAVSGFDHPRKEDFVFGAFSPRFVVFFHQEQRNVDWVRPATRRSGGLLTLQICRFLGR